MLGRQRGKRPLASSMTVRTAGPRGSSALALVLPLGPDPARVGASPNHAASERREGRAAWTCPTIDLTDTGGQQWPLNVQLSKKLALSVARGKIQTANRIMAGLVHTGTARQPLPHAACAVGKTM